MSETALNWTEEDSAIYQVLAAVAVPEREQQIATLVALLPFGSDDSFTVLELGSGEGYLSEVILECYPNATVKALDGSPEMRRTTSERLARFGDRFSVAAFDIEDLVWLEHAQGMDCVVSSLCVHHLHGSQKREMFTGLAGRLNPGGALLIADLVAASHPIVQEYMADTWDHETQRRARDLPGKADGWSEFQKQEWNLYRFPDEMDRPSPLADQLLWLREAGFDVVDCFWLKAGHAIYGGFMAGGSTPVKPVGFERALAASRRALGMDAE